MIKMKTGLIWLCFKNDSLEYHLPAQGFHLPWESKKQTEKAWMEANGSVASSIVKETK